MGLHTDSGRQPITARGLMDQARGLGLAGVELPVSMLDGQDVEQLGAYARAQGLFVTVDTSGFDPEALARVCELAARVGSPVVRTVIGGDRRRLAGRWRPFLDDVAAKLTTATRAAEASGVTLAVENHQDLASEELLWLCDKAPAGGCTCHVVAVAGPAPLCGSPAAASAGTSSTGASPNAEWFRDRRRFNVDGGGRWCHSPIGRPCGSSRAAMGGKGLPALYLASNRSTSVITARSMNWLSVRAPSVVMVCRIAPRTRDVSFGSW